MSQICTFFQVFPVLLQIPCLSSALSLHSILEIIKEILSFHSFEELDVSLELVSRGQYFNQGFSIRVQGAVQNYQVTNWRFAFQADLTGKLNAERMV